MIPVHPVALTPRSVALRLHRPGALYRLDPPVPWRLVAGGTLREGLATTVVIAIHDLDPGTAHLLEAEGFARFSFDTPPCGGRLDIRDFGAAPDRADNASAIQAAVAAVPPAGTVVVPPGRWLTRPVFLKSDMVLHLSEGTELAATGDRSGWPILPDRGSDGRVLGTWEGRPDACHAALVTAIDARNLAIAGPGTLDGGGDRGDWWTWPKGSRNGARRARAVHLIDCARVTLLGPTVRNSPSWTIHPQGCTDLVAAALRIEAPHESPNTDGLNPESCERVIIEGVHFSVGDDCIAIKAGKRAAGDDTPLRPTRDVTVRHCRMECGHGGVVIGSEMSGGVHDVVVAHCEMQGTDRGLRIKTRRGRGGAVTGIAMQDVTMDGVLTAFSANAFYHCDADGHAPWVQSRQPAPVGPGTPVINGILIEDVRVTGLSHALGAFLGLPESPVTGVQVARVTVGPCDPGARAAPPDMADHLRPMRHEMIAAEWAEITADDPGLLSGRTVSLGDPDDAADRLR
jgi:polygalacturonase